MPTSIIGFPTSIIGFISMPVQEMYELYKKRERVEKLFDTYKNVLDADRLYLQYDESVFGHVFISFLSLYAYCELEEMLKKAELNRKMSPGDLLLQYSKVYHIRIGDRTLTSEVPKKVIEFLPYYMKS